MTNFGRSWGEETTYYPKGLTGPGYKVKGGKVVEKETKTQYPIEDALEVGLDLVVKLGESVDRIHIGGSIRRGKRTVGDIELVCIPKLGDYPVDLFGEKVGPSVDVLDETIKNLIVVGTLALRPNKKGNTTYGPASKLLIHVPSGIPVDVFSTTEKYWGMALVVRTGPADFNIRAMKRFKHLGLDGHAYGGVTRGNPGQPGFEAWDCPEEQDVFTLLNWKYQDPQIRT